MRKSVSVRSVMETPLLRSSMSMTVSCNLSNCLRRYSKSFIGLPDCCSMRFSSPVAETSSNTMRPLTRCSKPMYSSSSMLGQKFTSWMLWLSEPMRSIRPKRWMIRTGFQWMS
ncbi:hypothetical protein D3C71_1920670 [compost metagenome]